MARKREWVGSAASEGASKDGGTTIRLGICLGKSEQLIRPCCRAMCSPPGLAVAALPRRFWQQSSFSVAQDSSEAVVWL